MLLSNQSSGVSIREVSPITGGIIGPIDTFGYPNLPIKTLGGDEPPKLSLSIKGVTLSRE